MPALADPAGEESQPSLALIEVLRRATAHLARVGLATARLDAELLLAHALQVGRLDLYLQFDRPLGEGELARFRPLLAARARRTPVAYLTGEREFMGLAFAVRPGVLIPRPDTELLARLGVDRCREWDGGAQVVDLGTGSGCVAVTLAVLVPTAQVEAVDVSEIAVEVARENAGRHHVLGRVSVVAADWRGLHPRRPYDLVVSNPPYVTSSEWLQLDPEVGEHEPRLALEAGDDGLFTYRSLAEVLDRVTAKRSRILLEVDPRRARQVADLFSERWPGAEVSSHADLTRRPRVVEVVRP